VSLRTRALLSQVSNETSWDGLLPLIQAERDEIAFWFDNLRLQAVRTLHLCSSAGLSLYSDASDGGLGAIVHRRSGNLVAAHRLDERERAGSSTARELQGILFAIESFAWVLAGKRAVLQCDNQGAVAITSKGSPK
jgi:hypothetical protein